MAAVFLKCCKEDALCMLSCRQNLLIFGWLQGKESYVLGTGAFRSGLKWLLLTCLDYA